MNPMTRAELKRRASDIFNFILLWCPDFPPERNTSTAREFDRLTELINAAIDGARSQDSKQWLRICMQEIQQSRKNYEDGDSNQARQLIQRAEEHFKSAFARNQIAPRFIGGEFGPAQDVDAGFPT